MTTAFPKPPPRERKPKPLRARAPMRRGRRLKAKNPERKREAHEQDFSGGIEHHRYIQLMDCCLCKARSRKQQSPTEAAHVKTRATGGRWYDVCPLCYECHREQEAIGNQRILAVYGIDLPALARRLTAEHLKQIGAIP